MASPDWVDCPLCGAHLKENTFRRHKAKVHPSIFERIRRPLLRAGGIAFVLVLLIGAGVAIVHLGKEAPVMLSDTDDPFIGDPDAPLTVYLFEDFQCPHCRNFETSGNADRLIQEYVEPGRVRIVYKDLAFLGPDSITAAQASQAVWELAPGAWHDWVRIVFVNQGPERSGWASASNLKALTAAWGKVDMDAFNESLDSGRWVDEVRADYEEAAAAGVTSTPTLVVGNARLNANDLDAVRAAIDDALATIAETPEE